MTNGYANFQKSLLKASMLAPSYRSALEGRDYAIVMTEWDEFRSSR